MATPKPQPLKQKFAQKRTELPPPEIEWWRHRLPGPGDGEFGDIFWAALFQWTIHTFRARVKALGIPHRIIGQVYWVDAAHIERLANG